MNSPYPQAHEIMGQAPGGTEQPGGAHPAPGQPPQAGAEGKGAASNPMARVIEAFQTIAMVVSMLEERGDPKAVQAKGLLTQLMQLLSGGQGQKGEQPQAAPSTGPAPAQMGAAPQGGRPMNPGQGGAPAGAKVM